MSDPFKELQSGAGNAALAALLSPNVERPAPLEPTPAKPAATPNSNPAAESRHAGQKLGTAAVMRLQRVAGNAAVRTLVGPPSMSPTQASATVAAAPATTSDQAGGGAAPVTGGELWLPGAGGGTAASPPGQPARRTNGSASGSAVAQRAPTTATRPVPVQRLGEGLLEGVRSRLGGLVGGVRSGWDRVTSLAGSAVSTVRDAARSAAQRVQSLGQRVIDGAKAGWSRIQGMASAIADGLTSRLRQMAAGVQGAASSLRAALKNLDADSARTAWVRLSAGVGRLGSWVREAAAGATQRLSAAWQGVRGGVGAALNAISPTAVMEGAVGLATAARDRLAAAWGFVARAGQGIGSLPIPSVIQALIDNLLAAGRRVWSGVQNAWGGVRDRVSGLADSVRSTVGGVWDRVRAGVTSFGQSLSSGWSRLSAGFSQRVGRLTGGIGAIVGRIASVSLTSFFEKLGAISRMVKAIRRGIAAPEATLAPLIASITSRLQAGMPGQAHQEAATRLSRFAGGGGAQAQPAAVPIQRQVVVQRDARSTAYGTIFSGIGTALDQKWSALSIGGLIKGALLALVWPWPAVAQEFRDMLKEWGETADSLFGFRTSGVLDWLHDLWTNILHLLDFLLILIRRLINILTLLMGWITLALVLIGAFLPALAGTVLGAIFSAAASLGLATPAGAAAGAAVGGTVGALAGLAAGAMIGEALMIAFIATAATSIAKAFVDLLTARQTLEQKGRDFNQVADSLLGIGVAVVLFTLSFIGGRIAGAAIKALRDRPVAPPREVVTDPATTTKPAEGTAGETKPAETGEPAATTTRGAPMRPGETIAQFGQRLAEESRGQPSRFDYIVGEINKAGLSQQGAAEAGTAGTVGIGLRLVRATNGQDIVLASVMPGSGKPVLIVKPNGTVVRGTATIAPTVPLSIERPITVTDVVEGK